MGSFGTRPSGRLQDPFFNTSGFPRTFLIFFLDFVGFCFLIFFRYIENQYVMTKNIQRVPLEVSIHCCYKHEDGRKSWFEIS